MERREHNNSKRRLNARGGRRVRKVEFIEKIQQKKRVNTATGDFSLAKDAHGNYIVASTVPAHMTFKHVGRKHFHDQPVAIPEKTVYQQKVDEYTVRVAK